MYGGCADQYDSVHTVQVAAQTRRSAYHRFQQPIPAHCWHSNLQIPCFSDISHSVEIPTADSSSGWNSMFQWHHRLSDLRCIDSNRRFQHTLAQQSVNSMFKQHLAQTCRLAQHRFQKAILAEAGTVICKFHVLAASCMGPQIGTAAILTHTGTAVCRFHSAK